MKLPRSFPGFTLIELLVTLVIVALLAALAFPVFRRMLENSRATQCIANLRQLGVGLNLYLGEHNAIMPEMKAGRADRIEEGPVLDEVLLPFVRDPSVFACPSDGAGFAARTGTSYFWNPALNGQALAGLTFLLIADVSRIPLISDKEGFHPYAASRVNILFADGHATKELRFFISP